MADATVGERIGPFWFTPGWSRGNAATVWLASVFTIGLAAFMSLLQPYLLNAVLDVPRAEQGRLTGQLGFLQEIIVIVLAGFVGAWSDRVGRRLVFCLGLMIIAAGYVIYPLATDELELVLFRFVFAVGVAMTPLMLSACVVDAIQERSRGRWVGSNNLLQGLGVVLVSFLLVRMPETLVARGFSPVAAGQIACWTAAGIALLTAVCVARGLPGFKGRTTGRADLSLTASVARALGLARHRPRLALAYGAAFIGRGDFVVIGAFFSLWVTQAGIAEGMSPAASLARGGALFGILQLAAVCSAFFVGMLADRVDRVVTLALALGMAAFSYFLLGASDDPFARPFLVVVVLAGIGEMSVIVASSALLGQEAASGDRGPIVGLYNAAAGIGILFATLAGGYVFDHLGATAPFTMMAILNLVLLVLAVVVRLRDPRGA
jgi:MFS family permease